MSNTEPKQKIIIPNIMGKVYRSDIYNKLNITPAQFYNSIIAFREIDNIFSKEMDKYKNKRLLPVPLVKKLLNHCYKDEIELEFVVNMEG